MLFVVTGSAFGTFYSVMTSQQRFKDLDSHPEARLVLSDGVLGQKVEVDSRGSSRAT